MQRLQFEVVKVALPVLLAAGWSVACSPVKSPLPAAQPEAAGEPAGSAPFYVAASILPDGGSRAAPLAPGMLLSIYGENLGPETPCTGSPEPERTEAPNPFRPNQTRVERLVFPKSLCETEVRVGGIAAGLLYVQAQQINFKVPQELPVEGETEVRVFYQGRAGPAVILPLSREPNTEPAEQLVERIWSELQRVAWNAPYRAAADAGLSCEPVVQHHTLRGGLYGHAYYCAQTTGDVIAEYFYYPVDHMKPTVLLRRADFRLAKDYPAMSVEVEGLLRERLNRAFGQGKAEGELFEIGMFKRSPGTSWRIYDIAVFLHRNRQYVAPVGVREGVTLIAVRREVLQERELVRGVEEAFRTSTTLAPPKIADDLKRDLGGLYLSPGGQPESEAERTKAERATREALLELLRKTSDPEGKDRNRRAAILVAADDLAVRLGTLLVTRSREGGGEVLGEAPNAAQLQRQLAAYGVRYDGIGHHSAAFEYDRSLLRRAWEEFPDTPWGQRALLMIHKQICSIPRSGCQGPNCFRDVIRQSEKLLLDLPGSLFRTETIFQLALAHETWWSLSQAKQGDPSAEGAQVDKQSAEEARKKAIELYEELLALAPDSVEARSATVRLPWLKLRLGTGERTFFCFHC